MALKQEFDIERSHHQKIVSDYTRLQQRFENLQGDIHLLASPPAVSDTPLFAQNTDTLYEREDSERIMDASLQVLSFVCDYHFK